MSEDNDPSWYIIGLSLDQCIWRGYETLFISRCTTAWNELGKPSLFRVMRMTKYEDYMVAFFVAPDAAAALDAAWPEWRENLIGRGSLPADADSIFPL